MPLASDTARCFSQMRGSPPILIDGPKREARVCEAAQPLESSSGDLQLAKSAEL
jgi:hypothetical protein